MSQISSPRHQMNTSTGEIKGPETLEERKMALYYVLKQQGKKLQMLPDSSSNASACSAVVTRIKSLDLHDRCPEDVSMNKIHC